MCGSDIVQQLRLWNSGTVERNVERGRRVAVDLLLRPVRRLGIEVDQPAERLAALCRDRRQTVAFEDRETVFEPARRLAQDAFMSRRGKIEARKNCVVHNEFLVSDRPQPGGQRKRATTGK